MHKRLSVAALGTSALAMCAMALVGAGPALAHGSGSAEGGGADHAMTLHARLTELNGSGASGRATVVVRGEDIKTVGVRIKGLSPDAPHAQHIHFGDEARQECPALFKDDKNRDGRLTTTEGAPGYGPIVVSLTTNGDTSPASALAVTRFPVAEHGRYHYSRSTITFTDVPGAGHDGGTASAEHIAEEVREGEAVVVVHGIDYNGDGRYSNSKEGASDLDPSLPAEATDPVACGILH
ncbi:hypothetical protein [Georgenia sp. SYP-B2076]|uniref:hypothetical protein n=1 Tax=Georgenia sp. SYP-B2076 TaxID=2495881 RepID=UPI000F8D48BD|nr:hypothetical protein [Georgenia sp. SYP-B2076]